MDTNRYSKLSSEIKSKIDLVVSSQFSNIRSCIISEIIHAFPEYSETLTKMYSTPTISTKSEPKPEFELSDASNVSESYSIDE